MSEILLLTETIVIIDYSQNYLKAFSACRKHRIDMNVIVDHDQAAFFNGLSSFIEQVDDVDHINLFLTSLGYAPVDLHDEGMI